MKKTSILKNIHLLASIIPLFSFVIFITYILRVVLKLGVLPKFHKQESFSYIHNEIVWFFLVIGYLSPILWMILTMTLKIKSIKINKLRIIIWVLGVFALNGYLLFMDTHNLLGWFID